MCCRAPGRGARRLPTHADHLPLEAPLSTHFEPVARDMDPYLLGQGGNCGVWRVPDGRECVACLRRHSEWHQRGCPHDLIENALDAPPTVLRAWRRPNPMPTSPPPGFAIPERGQA